MLNSVIDFYLFSSLSFSVYYSAVFKSRMCNLTFEFLQLYSFFTVFLFFFIPVEGLCCRPKYWANMIHRFDDQNSLTSCIENWALFERLTHSQQSVLSACPRAPRGAGTYIRENISFARRSTAFWGVYPAERLGNSL